MGVQVATMTNQCNARDDGYTCERPRGHEGWHRAELGKPDPQHGVAIMASSDEKTLAAAVVSWS